MGIVMRHEARQVPSWLIFDVRQFMRTLCTTLGLIFGALSGNAAELGFTRLNDLTFGLVAFCRPSIIDELQIIGEPRKLNEADLKKLAAVLSSEETWYERQQDGSLKGLRAMCMPHWDFKFLLDTKAGDTVSIRLCTSCRQVAILVGPKELQLPDVRSSAMARLKMLLDEWFPGWPEITAKNKREPLKLSDEAIPKK